MDDDRVETYTAGADRSRVFRRPRRHSSIRVLIAIAITAMVVAYVVYMSMGMPGMNHPTSNEGAWSLDRVVEPIVLTGEPG